MDDLERKTFLYKSREYISKYFDLSRLKDDELYVKLEKLVSEQLGDIYISIRERVNLTLNFTKAWLNLAEFTGFANYTAALGEMRASSKSACVSSLMMRKILLRFIFASSLNIARTLSMPA